MSIRTINQIHVQTSPNRVANGKAAAALGATLIRKAIQEKGKANIIVATGASQFEMIEALLLEPGIAWDKVTAFHLDEYVGIPVTHPASFRIYLWTRFQKQLPVPLLAFHYVSGEGNPQAECDRLDQIIKQNPIDLCFAGIGENAHLAFNDPPADFETEKAYL
ncbi:MAG: 6-phosphogluconolactonase, partial [Verrucomicrobiota bacterium]